MSTAVGAHADFFAAFVTAVGCLSSKEFGWVGTKIVVRDETPDAPNVSWRERRTNENSALILSKFRFLNHCHGVKVGGIAGVHVNQTLGRRFKKQISTDVFPHVFRFTRNSRGEYCRRILPGRAGSQWSRPGSADRRYQDRRLQTGRNGNWISFSQSGKRLHSPGSLDEPETACSLKHVG